jgi:hypothetical protein
MIQNTRYNKKEMPGMVIGLDLVARFINKHSLADKKKTPLMRVKSLSGR